MALVGSRRAFPGSGLARPSARLRVEDLEGRVVPTLPGDVLGVGEVTTMQTPTPTRPLRAPATIAPNQQFDDAESLGETSGTRAPPLLTSFDAIDFPTNVAQNGAFITPPDPHGAVGPNHLVSVVNLTIKWSTKANANPTVMRLGRNASNSLAGAFFDLPGTANDPQISSIGLFDPRVIYDQYADRFVVICAENTDTFFPGDPANSSFVFIGVSQSNDPNGAWNFQRINTLVTIGGSPCWLDFPALAVDSEAIYITGNYFLFGAIPIYQGGRLFVLPKGIGSGGIYDAGGTSAATIFNPAALTGQSDATLAPAHMFGAAPGTLGTFLVRYDGNSDGANEFLSVIRINDPLGTPTFSHQSVPLGNIDFGTTTSLPSISQLGTEAVISPGDRRVLQAVWRNNNLYAVFHVRPQSGVDAFQTTAHWVRINTGSSPNFPMTLGEQGNIGGEDISPTTSTFYPSVAVDAGGNIGFGFSASSETIFAGAYYTAHAASDAAGSVQSTGVLQSGLGTYIRDLGSGNRWGDYTGAAIDPVNQSIWILGQYAMLPGQPSGGDGRWSTRWGNFTFPDAVAPTIAGLFFDGTSWSAAFRTAAGNANFGFPAQTGASQFASMPWNALDTIYVQFSEAVNPVSAAQVAVRGINQATYPLSDVAMATPNLLRIRLAASLGVDRVVVALDGSSGSAIVDFAGNKLAGTFSDGGSLPTSGPAGVDFKFRFVIGVGDASRDGLVRNLDLNAVRNNLFVDAGAPGYSIFADIDGNGQTRAGDLAIVRDHLFLDPPVGPGPNRPNGGEPPASGRRKLDRVAKPSLLTGEPVSLEVQQLRGSRRSLSAAQLTVLDALFGEV